jgi:peptide/nickel transport system permease protein
MRNKLTTPSKFVRELHEDEGIRGQVARRFVRNRLAMVGLLFTMGYIVVALLGPLLVTSDPNAINATARFETPGLAHPFGTDRYGRDVLLRIVVGARESLYVALAVVVTSTTVGVSFGLLAGYFRGYVDETIMRFVDVLFAFPSILLALVIIAILGPGLNKAVLALAIAFVPIMIRVTRGSAISTREEEYILAAIASGENTSDIMFRHMLPNLVSVVVVQATITFAFSILAEAGLSYLGLSAQPPTITWGVMISDGQSYIGRAPWVTFFPGLAIMLTVLGLTFLGVGLRDALDPKTDIDTNVGGGL